MREQRRERRWRAETREQTHSKNIITGATRANPLKKNITRAIGLNPFKKMREMREQIESRNGEKMESRDERERRAQTK